MLRKASTTARIEGENFGNQATIRLRDLGEDLFPLGEIVWCRSGVKKLDVVQWREILSFVFPGVSPASRR